MGMLLLIFCLFVPPGQTEGVHWDTLGDQNCKWTVTDLTMESTARALLHYCLATAPASEQLMTEIEEVKTPDAVVEKFCHSTGSLTRFQSSIFDLLDATWRPDRNVNHNYDFLLTLTDKVKMKNYEAARRAIGSFLADIYRRVVQATECPTPAQQRMIMAGAETLYSQVRGIVGNQNFARLFGLKSLSKPAINLNGRVSRKEALTMSRVGVALYTDKPAAIYASASENRAKIVQLGISNHADLNTATLYMDVMRDVQPGTTIFIVTSSPLPALSDNFISTIGAAQTSSIAISVVLVSASRNIPPRSQDLYAIMAKFTKGKVYKSSTEDLYKLIPLMEYGLLENQALVLARVVDSKQEQFSIPSDRSMKAMTVEVNCGLGSPRIKLFEPKKRSHFEFVELSQIKTTGFWLIENVIPGKWEVDVKCVAGPIDIVVKSESSINFQVHQFDHENRESDLVIKSLSLPKLKLTSAKVIGARGTDVYANATVHHQVARLTKMGDNGAIDYNWLPDNDGSKTPVDGRKSLVAQKVAGPLSSQQPLVAQITALDEKGDAIQREFTQYDNRLEVKDDVSGMDFQPGSTIFVTIKVTNMGETLHLTATDYEGWVQSIAPATTSALDKNSLVKVRIVAPNDVRVGHETTVTVTARNNNLNRIESVKFVLAVGQTENPEVKKMLVDSVIENRFGRTIVQSRVENKHRSPRDAVFSVFLPHSAFITSYQLYIRNHTFKGEIIEPKHLGAPTDWVSPSTVVMEDEHEWRVKVRLEEWGEALFELVYDQPITKSDGKHPYKVNLQGKQKIDDLDIQVALYDDDGIKDVSVIPEEELMPDAPMNGFGFRGLDTAAATAGDNGGLGRMGGGLFDLGMSTADIKIDEGRKSAKISFNPMESILDMSRSQGIPGAFEPEPLEEAKFNMEYKTEEINADDYCTVSADGEYFVQFCDPPLPSFVSDNATLGEYSYDVILMLDASGSMYGEKLAAAVDALNDIIRHLPETDSFNIIRYANNVRVWRQFMLPAADKHKEAAKAFLADTKASGATDLKGALEAAIELADLTDLTRIPIILFLTDGGPHVGEVDFQSIVSGVSELASHRISINGISLGSADPIGWQLVQRLSARNRGLSARMFDIQHFARDIPKKFREMRSHARSMRGLTDIRFSFDSNVVEDLTDTAFFDYAEGADLAVLGKFKDQIPTHLAVQIQYKDLEKKVWQERKVIPVRQLGAEDGRAENVQKFAGDQHNYNPVKQQWAVTAVHQLLKRRTMATTQAQYDSLTLKAKELSYAHNIVSPVVSFLVRKPKSALNLINSDKLDGRVKRDAGKAEAHEVRYQYRKLWWRSDHKDEMEKATGELLKVQPAIAAGTSQSWTGIGANPVKVFIPLVEEGHVTCLTLPPSVNGTFTLYSNGDLTTSANIKDRKLESLRFRSGDATIEITATRLTASKDGQPMAIADEQKLFKIGTVVVERDDDEAIVVTNMADSVQFRIQRHSQGPTFLDVQVFGIKDDEEEERQGLMAELVKFEASLIETPTLRKHQTSTLWINGQYIPVLLTHSSFGSNEECWNVKEDSSTRIFHN